LSLFLLTYSYIQPIFLDEIVYNWILTILFRLFVIYQLEVKNVYPY